MPMNVLPSMLSYFKIERQNVHSALNRIKWQEQTVCKVQTTASEAQQPGFRDKIPTTASNVAIDT